MNVIIKELNNDPDEIENVQEFLFEQIRKEFHYGYIPEYHQDIMDMVNYYISPCRNNFFVAYDKETKKIIGTIGLRSYDKNFDEFKDRYNKNNTSSIWRLFVDKEYRRCGLASSLVKMVETFAYDAHYNNIYLHTHKNLDAALIFWKKMGFKITIDTNDKLQTVHMEKKINNVPVNSHFTGYIYALKL